MTQIFSDNFDRADSTTIGGNWVEDSGDYSISGNKLTVDNTAGALIKNTTSLGTADYKVSATIQTGADEGGPGLVARYIDVSNFYLAFLNMSANLVEIYKNVSGFTALSSGAVTLNANTDYLLRFEVQGNALRAYVDGNLITSITDGSLTLEGDFGCRRGGATSSNTWDNYLVEDFTTGGRTVIGQARVAATRTVAGARTVHPGRTAV